MNTEFNTFYATILKLKNDAKNNYIAEFFKTATDWLSEDGFALLVRKTLKPFGLTQEANYLLAEEILKQAYCELDKELGGIRNIFQPQNILGYDPEYLARL